MTDDGERRIRRAVTDGGTGSMDVPVDTKPDSEHAINETMPEPSSDGQQEFLLEAIRRAPLLRSLKAGAADTGDLLESVDISRSTLHRATDSLEEHDIIKRVDGESALTSFGRIVAEQVDAFGTRAWTAVSLKHFLNSINGNSSRIPIEYFADAEITRRRPRHPHATIHRIIKLFEESDDLRMFSTVISPVYVDVGYREMMDGMQIEAIFDREVLDIMLSESPEKAHETISTGNFNVYAHDGLPFELFIFDGKIGMAAHNQNGNAEVLVECDQPSAIEWAEDLYERHRSKADPLMSSDFG